MGERWCRGLCLTLLLWSVSGCEAEPSLVDPEPPAHMGTVDAAAPEVVADAGPTDVSTPTESNGGADCIPDPTWWTEEGAEQVETFCGDCHGETPQFGATASLTTYESLLTEIDGVPLLTQIGRKLSDGSMPPRAAAQPGSELRAALLDWATCGVEGAVPPVANPGGDFDADRPVWADPGEPPSGTDFFDLRADEFAVSSGARDHYECFAFEVPVGEDRFIRRIETIVDDARVLHHTILLPEASLEPGAHGSCNDDNPLSLVYGWAPGQGALQFEDGGIRIRPGQRLTLQIHYNNAAGHPGVHDSSGVRIYHGPVEGPEVSMLTFGPVGFRVAPFEAADVDGWCQITQPFDIVASFPHMHEQGIGFRQNVTRGDGTVESVINLDGWDFNAQYIYDTPISLEPGDIVQTTCRFQNTADTPLRFGSGTADEMCFNFAYVSPPPIATFCNQNEPPIPDVYVPGECAPQEVDSVRVPVVRAEILEGNAPALEGGDWPEGLWKLYRAQFYLPSLTLGPFALDAEMSSVKVLGLAEFDAETVRIDAQAELHVVADGLVYDLPFDVGFAGPHTPVEDRPEAFRVEADCGRTLSDRPLQYGYDGGLMVLRMPIRFQGISGALALRFKPAQRE